MPPSPIASSSRYGPTTVPEPSRARLGDRFLRRGSLTIWVDQQALDAWDHQGPPRWGAKFVYSDTAIQCLLTLRAVFHLPLRATQGMARSIFDLMGLELGVPHYSTLSRRAATWRWIWPGGPGGRCTWSWTAPG